jgi:hypothetical protein
MKWFDWMRRRVAEETPKTTYCPHGQNPQACLDCWRAKPTVPREAPKPDPEPKTTRIVHMACGCRLSLKDGTAWNLSQCGQHNGMKLDATWFWHEHKGRIAHYEHSVKERDTCDDQRCMRAAKRRSEDAA